MARSFRLARRRLLDPRPAEVAGSAPIRDAVNIPLSELPDRTHELPPTGQTIEIAQLDQSSHAARDWLAAHGRSAVCVRGFELGRGNPDEVGRLWEPTPFLAEALDQIAGSTALDLACGTGRDAVFLASRGWHVLGVDVLRDAIQRAAALAQRCAAAIQPPRWAVLDLEGPDVRIAETFDLITVFRYLHRALISRLRTWLNPGGVVVYETFTTLHRERHGKPANDAHVLRPGELPDLFPGYKLEHYSEAWRGMAHTARLIARPT